MNVRDLNSFIRAQYAKLPQSQRPIALLMAGVLLLFVITLLLKGCFHIIANIHRSQPAPLLIRHEKKIIIPNNSPLRSQLMITTIKSSTLAHIISVPGVVEADPANVVTILPPLTGRLIKLNVKLGDVIKRHQTLAVIRSPGLAQAFADRDKAQSILTLTTTALKRAKNVNRAGGNTIKDVEMAQSTYLQAQAELYRAIATLKTLGKNSFSLLRIQSPIDGRVTSMNYGTGSYITDPTAPLMTISNLTSVWVTASIPENLVRVVAKNLPVEVFLLAYPNQILHGKVSFVNAFLEPDTRRNKTRIAFTNPNGKLQPNMYATIKIATREPDQVIIPVSSIVMNNDTTSVFVETTPWTLEQHDVELGAEDGENVRVLKGLRAGDRIVTAGGVLVND